jgi:predicted Rossmann fold flavoprotein
MPVFARTIIVGAGPAGLTAAIASGMETLALERNAMAGRKLLLSGSGQCNLTNVLDAEGFLRACGKSAHFLKPAFYSFDNSTFMSFLEHAGCPLITREDGKVFPLSLNAADVRDALLRKAIEAGAEIICNTRIKSVSKTDKFNLVTDRGMEYISDKLILAGGGCSYPNTGSDGSVISLAKSLGHSVIKPRPSLAPVTIAGFAPYRSCSGISLKKCAATFITETDKHKATGDLLWTHTGLSGPLILDNAYLLAPGDVIRLSLVPRAESRVPEVLLISPRQSLLQALRRFDLPENLLRSLLLAVECDPSTQCSSVSRQDRQSVVHQLSALELTVAAVGGFGIAMSTSGGIPLTEVKARSMESKLFPGLYFAGEMLDYDLPSGGFNIQMAVSTGWLAGQASHQS